MKDTEMVRSYCANNQGGVFDLNYLSNTIFKDIPVGNLRKYVTRFVTDGTLRQISKGVYLIGDSALDDESRVINHYLKGSYLFLGMYAGESLLYLNKLCSSRPEITTIKSPLTKGNKRIGNVQILETRNICSGDSGRLMEVLEIINNSKCIDPDKMVYFSSLLSTLCNFYRDSILESMFIEYPRMVYIRLANILEDAHISNRVMDIYECKTRYENL